MTATIARTGREALRVEVSGLVQGVGFRPFVYRLAKRHELEGWVRNRSGDVEIALEGPGDALEEFLAELRAEAPPLARIEHVLTAPADIEHPGGFRIIESRSAGRRLQPIAADVAMCAACEREMRDIGDRRYRYPFITCTDCGPRYSVIESMPYDRERTTMRVFPQCDACRAEYEDPASRRYHSETNSCAACGPRLWIELADGVDDAGRPSGDPIAAAAELLRRGLIVAVRGIGGFHLAVDATNPAAVARLRGRKGRRAKPLALMVLGVRQARALAVIGRAEERWLASRERPIVLVPLRRGAPVAPEVAPGLAHVGIMLAYSPLHHLLLEAAGRPLVMTSGNLSEEPLSARLDEGRDRLRGIADAWLLHDRDIAGRIDDSVLRVVDDAPVFLRRARGYAPMPVPLPVPTPIPLVAVGPHLKNTFTLASGGDAYVSQHIGDLDTLETMTHFGDTLAIFRRRFGIEPMIAVRDQHPGYLSTRIAEELDLYRTIAVQHHHAHIAAVLGEHEMAGPVLGIAFDGTGYGADATIWGAELLVATLTDYQRVGHLRPARLPGGEVAVRTPWRSALGYALLEPAAMTALEPAFEGVSPRELRVARLQAERGINAPFASSMGRLFDAAAAVLGVGRPAGYEGEAAMRLESLAGTRPAAPLFVPLMERESTWLLDPVPLLVALAERRGRGDDAADLAAAFHESIAVATARLAARLAGDRWIGTVALGGGVFQNARLLARLREELISRGLRVLTPRLLSPNDGAVSYGQACVAAALLAREHHG